MTRELMSLAGGKIVLVLEGGYDIPSICDSAELSVRALLGEEVSTSSLHSKHRKYLIYLLYPKAAITHDVLLTQNLMSHSHGLI